MLNPLTKIRPEERRETFAATMTVFLVLVAHALLETARDALFLANAPTTRLPIVYLALAVCGVALAQLSTRGAARFDAHRSLLVSQTVAAAGTLAIWVSTRADTSAVYYGLYIWAGIASMSVLVPLWLHLSERFTPTQAKRLFPIIGAGSIAGVLVGYALSAAIARRLGTTALLPASALVYLTGALGPLVLGRRARREEGALDAKSGEHSKQAEQPEAANEEPPHAEAMGLWEAVAAAVVHPYVRRVSLLLLLASVTVTLVDYVFKTVVAQHVPPAELGPFFARTYFLFNVLSLATLVGAVGILLNRFGVIVMMALLPAFLLVGGLGVALVGGFAAAMALKGTDGAMHWSTHKTATELLYVPMPGEIRSAVKGVVDMATQRMGQAIGSLIILAVLAITNEVRVFGPLIALAAALWAFVTLRSREPYLDLFRDTLSEGAIETRVEFPDLDVGSLEALIVALNAPDDKKVIAAMDLLEQKRKSHLIPALVLYHPSPEVVVRALDLFAAARRSDFFPIVDRLLTHEYAEVRAAALRATTAVRPDPHALERALEHHCPVVNVTALVGLAAGGWRPVDETVRDLMRHVDEDSELARPMIARAIRYRPLSAFAPVLTRLAEAPEVETRREAVFAMRAARDVRFLPTLLGLLRERALREDVRDALVELGTPALDALESALGDASIRFSVRVHLPRTISRFQSQRAAEMLVRLLLAEPRGMVRFKALRGLGRLLANDPDMVLEEATLDEVLRRTMASCCRVLHWRLMLQNGAAEHAELRTSSQDLLVQLLLDKEQLGIERLFRTLGLRFREEDVGRIYDGLRSPSPLLHSSSRELLASALPASLGRAVLGLVDDDAPEVRLEAIREYYEVGDLDYPRLLAVLAADASPTLRSIASYHAAEVGVTTPEAEPVEDHDLPEAFARMRARMRELLRDREAIRRPA